jgi:REP element-mobilizing transposase RayT
MAGDLIFQPFDPEAEVEITVGDLPHWFQPGAALFVTFRTHDSMPKAVLDVWFREQLDWLARHGIAVTVDEIQNASESLITGLPGQVASEFKKMRDRSWHSYLDKGLGECLLRNPALAGIVAESIDKFDGERYDLDSYVIMPNHVHVLLMCRVGWTLRRVAKTWLTYTSRRINQAAGRSGHVWQSEPFDHLVRSERQFLYLRKYIQDNPVRAGLREGEFLLRMRGGSSR